MKKVKCKTPRNRDMAHNENYSALRAFIPKDNLKRNHKRVFDKGIGANLQAANGCAVQMADFPEAVDGTEETPPTEGKESINNVPQIIYGNYQRQSHISFKVKIYNFLERPTGWKCFAYHFTV